jgi:hypothetical protein
MGASNHATYILHKSVLEGLFDVVEVGLCRVPDGGGHRDNILAIRYKKLGVWACIGYVLPKAGQDFSEQGLANRRNANV